MKKNSFGSVLFELMLIAEEKIVEACEAKKLELARLNNTSPAILEELAYEKDFLVRDHVARNPNTPVAILKKLADDKNELVR